jgi:hypothetical protein
MGILGVSAQGPRWIEKESFLYSKRAHIAADRFSGYRRTAAISRYAIMNVLCP